MTHPIARRLTFFLLALTLLRLAVAAVTPLSPDEAYYWLWSRALQPGYLDHPPMVALWIRLGTWLCGQTTLGVRLLAPFAALGGSWFLYQTAEALFPAHPKDRASEAGKTGMIAVVLLNATLVLGAGAVVMTPDTPLLFFWTMALWAVARGWRSGEGRWWLIIGLATGAALDSKYTAMFLPFSLAIWMVATPSLRPWFRRAAPWVGMGLGFVLFLPVLVWNARHGWASFAKQGGRNGDFHLLRGVHTWPEFVLGQIGLATPLIFLACVLGIVWATRRWRRQPEAGFLATTTLLPFLVFAEHALGDRVQANWPCILYPTACLAAAGCGFRPWRTAAVLGFVLTVLVYGQAAAALFPLPRAWDPTLAQLGGWQEWATQLDALRRARHLDYIATSHYGEAALLRWYLPNTTVVIGVHPRWRFFSFPSASLVSATHPGLLLGEGDPPWRGASPLGMMTRRRRGIEAGPPTSLYEGVIQSGGGCLLAGG
jgi:4-amino-4-deoxy-L-arabinose transferase-like glycosyltransferase